MEEDKKDIFILQILVSSLTLHHDWSEFQMPVITVKIMDGPEVILPYRSTGLPTSLEENVQKSGIYTFEKGKSCLFATNLGSQPTINMYVMVHNAVDGQYKAIGSSELYKKQFDPDSLTVQTLLKGKLQIYTKQNYIIGNVSMAISLQAIGSFRGDNNYLQEENFPRLTQPINDRSHSYSKDRYKLPYEKSAVKKNHSSEDSISSPNYSEAFCSSTTESTDSNSVASFSEHESESFSDAPKGGNKIEIDETAKTINNNVEKRINSNEKPKGWLRSSPVYKGNILNSPPPIITTRSTFLNLSKKYPYLGSHVKNEVEKQLKEKIKILDKEYKEQMEKMKPKSRKSVPVFRTSVRASARVQKQNKQTQSNFSPRRENISKETAVGDSLKENFYVSCDEDDLLSEENDDLYLSADSHNSKISINKNESPKSKESSSKKYTESFATSSTSELDENSIRSKNSQDSGSLKKSFKLNTGAATVNESWANEQRANSEEEIEELISKGPSRKSSINYHEKHNLLGDRLEPNSSNGNQIQLVQKERLLQHQGSKTTTSIYPETTEEEIKRKNSKQSPRGIDDVDDSISNISARIAAILVPRKFEAPLIHTDSISSYEPSDFDEDLSSISKDEAI